MNTQKPPLEKKIVNSTLAKLRSRGGFWYKVHGSPYQQAGLPDIIGCYRGRFVSFEVKRDESGRASDLQAYTMGKIRAEGGVSTLIYTPEMALAKLDRIDALREAREHDHKS